MLRVRDDIGGMYVKLLHGTWQMTIWLYYHVLFPKDKQQDNVSLGLTMDNVNIHLDDISPYTPALWPWLSYNRYSYPRLFLTLKVREKNVSICWILGSPAINSLQGTFKCNGLTLPSSSPFDRGRDYQLCFTFVISRDASLSNLYKVTELI